MSETVDFVLAQAERELATVRELQAELRAMLDELEAVRPPRRPHLYIVRE